jgi:hypothetical protein
LKITRELSGSIDGVQLSRFQTGQVYDVGTSVGTYLLAIGSAEPVIETADVEVGPAEVPAAARKHSNASPPSAVAADRSPEAITGLPDR